MQHRILIPSCRDRAAGGRCPIEWSVAHPMTRPGMRPEETCTYGAELPIPHDAKARGPVGSRDEPMTSSRGRAPSRSPTTAQRSTAHICGQLSGDPHPAWKALRSPPPRAQPCLAVRQYGDGRTSCRGTTRALALVPVDMVQSNSESHHEARI
jgi:hypothetical protein